MQVLHNGYADPNNLVFENITVLGLSRPPMTVTINDGDMTTAIPESNIQYDSFKRVSACFLIMLTINCKLIVNKVTKYIP